MDHIHVRPNLAGVLQDLLERRKDICCNQIGVRQADTNEVGKHLFQAKTTVKETDVKEMLATLYNQEFTESGFPECKSENGMSVEDLKFMKIL